MKKKILLRGPFCSRSGYGEQARFALRSLKMYSDIFDIYLINVGWGQTGWIPMVGEERNYIESLMHKTAQYQQSGGSYDLSLQITIPNEFEKLAPVNIGYTAGIESDRIAPVWIEKSNSMDKLIVVSNHAKYGFDNTKYNAKNKQTGEVVNDFHCTTPIEVVNYPVMNYEKDEKFTKELDKLITTDFNFLVCAQWGPRKNVEHTILWFVEEFLNEEDVGLVLKISSRNNSIMDKYDTRNRINKLLENSEYKDRKCKIHLLHGDLTDEQMTSLYCHEKIGALYTLVHGEGAGLPILEAANNALPIVAPPWSGYCDFMFMPMHDKKKNKTKMKPAFTKIDYDLKPIQPEAYWEGVLEKESKWCFPKKANTKTQLREVYKNNKRCRSLAKKLQKHLKENFTEEEKYKQFAEAIHGSELKLISLKDIPTISLYTSVFDGADFIEPFLQDVTRQTIFDSHIELVLIHPKTSPGYKKENKIIKKYCEEFPNIHYHEIEGDPGLYACWNLGVEASTGEYVGNANLDDRMRADSVEMKAKALFANSDIDLVYSDMLITEKSNETFEKNTSDGRKYNFPESSFEALKMVCFPHSAPLYRMMLHDKYGYYTERYNYSADWEFRLRCMANGSKCKKVDDVLGLYHFNPKGVTTNPERFPEKQKEEQEVFERYKDLEGVK